MATKKPSDHFWYARNTSIFMLKTEHLSLMAMGAYDRLLDWYYQNRKPLSSDWVQLHRVCKAVAPEEQAVVREVVEEFFTLREDGWHNDKADKEIEKAQGLSQKRRDAQAERERKRLEKEGKKASKKGANGGAKQGAIAPTTNNLQEEDTNVSSPPTPKGERSVPDTFLMPDGAFLSLDQTLDRFWKLYPNTRDRGHKGNAKEEFIKKLKAGVDYETIGRGVARYARYCDATGEKNRDFFRWIRDSGWENSYDIPAQPQAGNGRNSGYSLTAAVNQALGDTTRRPLSEERLKALGMDDDTGDV